MPTDLTPAQRLAVLRFVAERSKPDFPELDGESFRLTDSDSVAGVDDLGYALLTLDGEDLCGVEDPDIVWSTPKGREAVKRADRRAMLDTLSDLGLGECGIT